MRAAELQSGRRRELLKVGPRRSSFASKMHLPLLGDTLIGLGMGGEDGANQFISGFPLIGSQSEEGVYPLKRDAPPLILAPEMLQGAPERCRSGMSPRKSARDPKLWEKGWLEGPCVLSRDAALQVER